MQTVILIFGGLIIAACLFGFFRGFFQPRRGAGANPDPEATMPGFLQAAPREKDSDSHSGGGHHLN